MTRLGALREAATPWLDQSQGGGPTPRAVHTADRADLLALDQMAADCTALAELDADLTTHYGAPGLVADLWLAAYSRDPQLNPDPDPLHRANHAITAGLLGTPEHRELRRMTVGDPYAAAMSVLAAGPALRKMLQKLDPDGYRKSAHRARADAQRAAQRVQPTYEAADDAVDGDRDAEVDRPLSTAVQWAIAAARAAEDHAAQALAELAEHTEDGELAVARVRAEARQSARTAEDALLDEQAMMAAWGTSGGQLQHLDPDERMRLAERLRGGKLAQFAELIGRFRQMSGAQRSRRVEHAKSEYVGVTLGDDLGALVPGEIVNLAVPALRAQFAARLAEQQLMVYDQRGEDHQAQGAIIACVDCSYSMTLTDGQEISGEAYAKALALALLDQARAATPVREFSAILFDHTALPPITFRADQPVSLEDKLRLAELFPAGGTDFQQPLDAAVRLLEAEYSATGRQQADIVLITDGDAELEEDWLAEWRQTKQRLGFRCFGVSVGWWAEEALALDKICDDVRRIDTLETSATADLFRAI
ncbi:VWA domain-containing protein [Kutzneria viridogrisea]|uniref:Uncharacterized protein with von Willebrand factor type A (VWA) domain n=1 Tax=Kutzneria viridogrisea TaxID=47990 RepID=A0ABR6BZ53_9PSEU|nr:uncharacterized protein with von Willebrand factor type A (vWA) domain [Kutzneria viridogrisea]